MFEKYLYKNIENKLNIILNNLDELIYNINTIENIAPRAILINGNSDYKNNIILVKKNLEKQSLEIKYNILNEIKTKL